MILIWIFIGNPSICAVFGIDFQGMSIVRVGLGVHHVSVEFTTILLHRITVNGNRYKVYTMCSLNMKIHRECDV